MGGAWEMDELTAEELDRAIAQEAEQIERERNKRRILALLEAIPADSVLWDRVLALLGMQEEA
jgi:hypothetical protein